MVATRLKAEYFSDDEGNAYAQTPGDRRMTGAQTSYIRMLSTAAGEEFDEALTEADASKLIVELQVRTGQRH